MSNNIISIPRVRIVVIAPGGQEFECGIQGKPATQKSNSTHTLVCPTFGAIGTFTRAGVNDPSNACVRIQFDAYAESEPDHKRLDATFVANSVLAMLRENYPNTCLEPRNGKKTGKGGVWQRLLLPPFEFTTDRTWPKDWSGRPEDLPDLHPACPCCGQKVTVIMPGNPGKPRKHEPWCRQCIGWLRLLPRRKLMEK